MGCGSTMALERDYRYAVMSEPRGDRQQVQIPIQKRKANEVELDAEMSPRSDDGEDEALAAAPLHPLFMDGLPSDFSSNPALAALASLLEEDDTASNDVPSKEKHSNSTVGGSGRKLRRISSRSASSGRETSPLTEPLKPVVLTNEATKKTTVGEASLFVKMWKL
jgi:hypothetical protein